MNKLLIGILLFCTSFLFAEQRVGYSKALVQVPVTHGDTVSGYLLVPNNLLPSNGSPLASLPLASPSAPTAPAILALHDHGAYFTIGKEKLTSPCPLTGKGCPQDGEGASEASEASAWVNKFYEGQFVADTLASRGYVVLVIDALYWGERSPSPALPKGREIDSLKRLNKRLKNEQPEFYQHYLNETGEPWFERILADDKAGIDYLLTMPYVDPARIGVWGFSMGAYRAWQLAAEDKRIAFCAAANWMQAVPETNNHAEPVPETNSDAAQSWQLKNVSSWSMYRPSKDSISYAEIASQIAPRPFLLQYGTRDHLFPDPVLTEGQWQLLTIQAIDSEHRFTREHMRLLLQWLRNL